MNDVIAINPNIFYRFQAFFSLLLLFFVGTSWRLVPYEIDESNSFAPVFVLSIGSVTTAAIMLLSRGGRFELKSRLMALTIIFSLFMILGLSFSISILNNSSDKTWDNYWPVFKGFFVFLLPMLSGFLNSDHCFHSYVLAARRLALFASVISIVQWLALRNGIALFSCTTGHCNSETNFFDLSFRRVSGFMYDPNIFAYSILICHTISIVGRPKPSTLNVAATAMIFIAIFCTGSRSGVVGFFFIEVIRQLRRDNFTKFVLFGLSAFSAVLFYFLSGRDLLDASTSERANIAKAYWSAIIELQPIFSAEPERFMKIVQTEFGEFRYAHDVFHSSIMTFGILPAFIFWVFLVILFISACRVGKRGFVLAMLLLFLSCYQPLLQFPHFWLLAGIIGTIKSSQLLDGPISPSKMHEV